MNLLDVDRIRASGGWRRFRTEAFETTEGPVIVKGQRPALDALERLVAGI